MRHPVVPIHAADQNGGMGIRELREKYGKNLKGRQAINAAIRAELPGGAQVLDVLGILGEDSVRSLGSANARALDQLKEAREAMADEIARRYDLATREE